MANDEKQDDAAAEEKELGEPETSGAPQEGGEEEKPNKEVKHADPEKMAAAAKEDKRADPEKVAALAKKAGAEKKPHKKPEVDEETRARLAGQRKALRKREFSEASGGSGKFIFLAVVVVALAVVIGGYKYFQASGPKRELKAWYESFREASRGKDTKTLIGLYSKSAERELQHAYKTAKIRKLRGDRAAMEAQIGPKMAIDESEREGFEKSVAKLLEKGLVGCDLEPQGFVVLEAIEGNMQGWVKVEGPDIRVVREEVLETTEGVTRRKQKWGFFERKMVVKRPSPEETPPAEGTEPEGAEPEKGGEE